MLLYNPTPHAVNFHEGLKSLRVEPIAKMFDTATGAINVGIFIVDVPDNNARFKEYVKMQMLDKFLVSSYKGNKPLPVYSVERDVFYEVGADSGNAPVPKKVKTRKKDVAVKEEEEEVELDGTDEEVDADGVDDEDEDEGADDVDDEDEGEEDEDDGEEPNAKESSPKKVPQKKIVPGKKKKRSQSSNLSKKKNAKKKKTKT